MAHHKSVPFLAATLIGSLALPTAVVAATPQSYTALDRQSAAACAKAANLRDSSVGPVTRFSDRAGVDVRVVSGTYPQAHMNGTSGTVVCLYDRRSKRAETQEPPADFLPVSAERSLPVKDLLWRAEDIGGGGIIDNSLVTLRLGSDGRLSGRSGCNQYSGGYSLAGSSLKVSPNLVSTRMACAPALMEQERRYQDLLGKARTLRMDANGGLVLATSDGRKLRFVAATDASTPTPEATAYRMLRCGNEQFRVSFGRDRALVELEDGSRVELPNINTNADPELPRTYTNGRLTFEQTIEGRSRINFARGRMAPVPCNVAQN